MLLAQNFRLNFSQEVLNYLIFGRYFLIHLFLRIGGSFWFGLNCFTPSLSCPDLANLVLLRTQKIVKIVIFIVFLFFRFCFRRINFYRIIFVLVIDFRNLRLADLSPLFISLKIYQNLINFLKLKLYIIQQQILLTTLPIHSSNFRIILLVIIYQTLHLKN